MTNVVFRELQELAGVAPLTAAQLGCFLMYLVSLLLLGIAEAFAALSSTKLPEDAEKQEHKEALMKKAAATSVSSDWAPEAGRGCFSHPEASPTFPAGLPRRREGQQAPQLPGRVP